ncbi:MAG: T9SS type A sorting domain-containing protein [Bacteroidota bacterium]
MKKILLTVAASAVCMLTANAQQRTVLYEEFTGENCGPCAAYNPGLESLMAANPTKVIHVTFMEPVPTTGYFYKSDSVDNRARYATFTPPYVNGYYQPLFGTSYFTPSGVQDGKFPESTGNISAYTQAMLDAEYAVPSPFTITATHYFNTTHDSIFQTVKVHCITPVTATLKLRAAWVKSMNFSHAPGNNGETHFENVVRKMFPNQGGTIMPSIWTAGMDSTFTFKGKISNLDTFTNVTTLDSNMVIWVQQDPASATATNVQQAAKSVYTPPTNVEEVSATAFNITVYPNPARESATVSFYLQYNAMVDIKVLDVSGRVIKNLSSQEMTSGAHTVSVSTTDMAAGVYLMNVQIGDNTTTQRMTVVK